MRIVPRQMVLAAAAVMIARLLVIGQMASAQGAGQPAAPTTPPTVDDV